MIAMTNWININPRTALTHACRTESAFTWVHHSQSGVSSLSFFLLLQPPIRIRPAPPSPQPPSRTPPPHAHGLTVYVSVGLGVGKRVWWWRAGDGREGGAHGKGDCKANLDRVGHLRKARSKISCTHLNKDHRTEHVQWWFGVVRVPPGLLAHNFLHASCGGRVHLAVNPACAREVNL